MKICLQEHSHGPPPGFSRAQATPSSAAAAPPWKSSHAPDSHLTRPPPGLSSSSSHSTSRQSGGQSSVTSTASTKKQKFVPLMSREGQSRMAMQLPGRHVCQCLAQKHDLVNNCVECGRIVCSQVKQTNKPEAYLITVSSVGGLFALRSNKQTNKQT